MSDEVKPVLGPKTRAAMDRTREESKRLEYKPDTVAAVKLRAKEAYGAIARLDDTMSHLLTSMKADYDAGRIGMAEMMSVKVSLAMTRDLVKGLVDVPWPEAWNHFGLPDDGDVELAYCDHLDAVVSWPDSLDE